MEWPSKRIPQGGVFQPVRVQYSPETHKLLKVLMEESKLTMMQRKEINYNLRSGDSLPNISQTKNKTRSRNGHKMQMVYRPNSYKRRSFNSIIESGVYERDKFVPKHPKPDREADKKRLQDLMAFGKEVDPTPRNTKHKTKITKAPREEINRFDELVQEINDRVEWLNEMEKLGQAKPHRQMIEQQIAARVREMEKLKVE